MRVPLSAIVLAIAACPFASAQQLTCKSLGQEFSAGATICECPSMKGSGRTASGGRTQTTSRRLVCTPTGEWKVDETFCLDVVADGGTAADDFPKFHDLFCPRPATALAEQTEKFFETAPNAQVLAAIRGICRRFPALATTCKSLVEVLLPN
jgi:hypothetical protein